MINSTVGFSALCTVPIGPRLSVLRQLVDRGLASLTIQERLTLGFLIPQVEVATDLSLRLRESGSTLLLVCLLCREVDVGVPRGDHTIEEAEASPTLVIEQRFLLCIGKDAEARGEDGFRGADVPHGVAGDKVHEEITLLIC